MIQFAMNRTCAPQRELSDFIELVQGAGVSFVELRNDVEGREFANGMPAEALRGVLQEAGLGLASVNALQRFNDWTPDREAEARDLIAYAAKLGAPGLVLCPVIDDSDPWSEAEAERNLRTGLRGLQPIFADHGITGYVEPLGMKGSTMKRQAMAVEAVTDIDAWDDFQLCYDTFQYFRSSDTRVFPEHIGLVHVSGITRTDLAPDELTEPDRGFVLDYDRVGNVAQVKALMDAGYSGFVSMEPFSPAIQTDPRIATHLAESFQLLAGELGVTAHSSVQQ